MCEKLVDQKQLNGLKNGGFANEIVMVIQIQWLFKPQCYGNDEKKRNILIRKFIAFTDVSYLTEQEGMRS